VSIALSRRSALGALVSLAPLPSVCAEVVDPFPAAIRRAAAADAAYREAGRLAREIQAAGQALPANWRAYRADLLQVRALARAELHVLTPTTSTAAAALISYYRSRAEASGDLAAMRAARSRLRKVFRRPGAYALSPLPQARASPD